MDVYEALGALQQAAIKEAREEAFSDLSDAIHPLLEQAENENKSLVTEEMLRRGVHPGNIMWAALQMLADGVKRGWVTFDRWDNFNTDEDLVRTNLGNASFEWEDGMRASVMVNPSTQIEINAEPSTNQ